MATAEASSNLARYDGVRYGFRARPEGGPGAQDDLRTMYGRSRELGFGAEVKRRIMLGTYVLSAGYYDAYYLKAQQVRTLIRRDYEQAFEQVDVVAMPTSPTPAFRIGERVADPAADVPRRRLHCQREPGRPAGGQHPVRLHRRSASDRAAADRPDVRRDRRFSAAAHAYERQTAWWKAQPTL